MILIGKDYKWSLNRWTRVTQGTLIKKILRYDQANVSVKVLKSTGMFLNQLNPVKEYGNVSTTNVEEYGNVSTTNVDEYGNVSTTNVFRVRECYVN